MYTIRHAAALAGVSVDLVRAWERRYGIVRPARTAAGYRLYDDAAVSRLRTMRALIDDGWSAGTAAAAVTSGQVAGHESNQRPTAQAQAPDHAAELIERFVAAAASFDTSELSERLDEMLISGAYERVVASLILPAMVRVGEEWAAGRLSVAAEHAATNAVARRLGAAFDGAAVDPAIEDAVVMGLPERSRHELGVLAFAVVARRAGLPVIYVGADLPSPDWLKAAATARAVVIAAPTAADRTSARRLAVALRRTRPELTVALGGRAAPHVDGCLQLSDQMEVAAAQLRTALG